jgi:hypothetical protein
MLGEVRYLKLKAGVPEDDACRLPVESSNTSLDQAGPENSSTSA